MADIQIALLIGLVVLIVLVGLARRVGISYPIVLVLGGLVLGFIPGLPSVQLDPNLVLLIFLPPLLYWESVTAPSDVMLANASQIGNLAIGLVVVTTFAVAAVMHAVIPGLPWAAAVVLGAIVAPTDELATAPVLERFRMPRHLIAIVEGESLVNDALSLSLYGAAVGAVASGTFDIGRILLWSLVGGVGAFVIGIGAGRIVVEAWRRFTDTQIQAVISVLLPYLAFVPAQRLGLSGVLAAVTGGVYVSRFTPSVLTPATRLAGFAVWETFVFFANALLFLLVGLQLRQIAGTVFEHYSWQSVLWYALVINAVVIIARLAWIVGTEYVPWLGASSEHANPNWKHAVVVSWSGLRGAVSLAAALAIPAMLANGTPFPRRDLIVFLTFTVILVTLVGGGLTLPAVIRALHLSEEPDEERAEVEHALAGIANAALARIAELENTGRIDEHHAETLRKRYRQKLRHSSRRRTAEELEHERFDTDAERDVIQAERDELRRMRSMGEIDNAVLRMVQRSLDLAESRLRQ